MITAPHKVRLLIITISLCCLLWTLGEPLQQAQSRSHWPFQQHISGHKLLSFIYLQFSNSDLVVFQTCWHCCNLVFQISCSLLAPFSMVDHIIVRQEDKAKVCNVKVIPNEEWVPKHKLLVMDMRFSTRKRRHKKFEPRGVYGSSRRKRHVKNIKEWSKIR